MTDHTTTLYSNTETLKTVSTTTEFDEFSKNKTGHHLKVTNQTRIAPIRTTVGQASKSVVCLL